MNDTPDPIAVIVGPTASGKSALAIALAQMLDAQIVNADSMQVYRGMDIGTAKVPPSERIVPHFCIDIVDPGQPFSAALFQRHARDAFDVIEAAGKQRILTGGTGFYIRAAIDDYDFVEGEQVGNDVRDHYLEMAQDQGPEAVWNELRRLDQASAACIHVNDVKRVIRALEMHAVGKSYAEQRHKLDSIPQAYPAVFIGINVDSDILCMRIDTRVDGMREEGLENEVQGLLDAGYRDAVTSNQAIGYKEIVAAFDGITTLDEAYVQIKTATKRYAKRQRTWFRGDARIHWIDGNAGNIEHMAHQALDLIKKETTAGHAICSHIA